MSEQKWKPGDVAMCRALDGSETRTMYVTRCQNSAHDNAPHWHHATGWDRHDAFNLSTYRPLVVIDAEDREQVERLTTEYVKTWLGPRETTSPESIDHMQAALREFASPTPPKPDEPLGLGAVVEATDGDRYVRHCPGDCPDKGLCIPWSRVAWGTKHKWSEVAAVRVLSEGVTP